mmetsp:Transcript_35116/g.91935  ORF Transcript_35116/g.91935 Transcript_35116/m.91935 type:complete len:501 (+) Transcript_35116:93-1595(+)
MALGRAVMIPVHQPADRGVPATVPRVRQTVGGYGAPVRQAPMRPSVPAVQPRAAPVRSGMAAMTSSQPTVSQGPPVRTALRTTSGAAGVGKVAKLSQISSIGHIPSPRQASPLKATRRTSEGTTNVDRTRGIGHLIKSQGSVSTPRYANGGAVTPSAGGGPRRVEERRDPRPEPAQAAQPVQPVQPAPATRAPQQATVYASEDKVGMSVGLSPSEHISWSQVEIHHKLNEGSFGEVFLATYQGREVAVKRCHMGEGGSMTKEQMHNLEREINTYRTLQHANIVSYIGCVLENPIFCIVTEYVPNGNLFDLLYMQRIALPALTRLKIATQLAAVVCYMHSKTPAIIHRDIKTQNLVADFDYNIKLCDFGKTKALDGESLKLHEDNGGSPRYMAPESFIPMGYVTEKVDIWSVGCCLVEIWGGPIPYEEECPAMEDVVKRILQDRHPPTVPHWFHPGAARLLVQCFNFAPAERPCVGEVQCCIQELTPEDLESHEMDRRRVR